MMRMKTSRYNRTVATVGLTALLWLLWTLTIPGPVQAAVYFDTDFESCNVGTGNDFPCEGWDDLGIEAIDHLEITNSLAFSGTKSVKGTWDNINGSSIKPSIYKTFPKSDHIFVRFATRQSPGFQIGSNNATKMMRFRTDGGFPVFLAMFYNGMYTIIVEGSYVGGTFIAPSSGITPSQTSWDQVEMEIQLNTPGLSDGLMRMWIKGVLRIERLNQQFRGPLPNTISSQKLLVPSTGRFDTAQIYVQSGLGSIYYDRFAVGNTRIGPASVGGDITPPARPTLDPIP
jgi:hypothetical protein